MFWEAFYPQSEDISVPIDPSRRGYLTLWFFYASDSLLERGPGSAFGRNMGNAGASRSCDPRTLHAFMCEICDSLVADYLCTQSYAREARVVLPTRVEYVRVFAGHEARPCPLPPSTPTTTPHFRLPQALMHNPNSYYAAPKCDNQMWMDWQHANRTASSSSWSGSASTSTTLTEDYTSNKPKAMNSSPISVCYSLTPPTPDTPTSDISSSQLSIDSESMFDDMPEIPFISSSSLQGVDAWAGPHRHGRTASDEPECERSFWASILRPRASRSSESGAVLLGHTSDRVLAPTRSRKRSGSVSSTASSRSKPAPAKSILSSSASIRSRQLRAPPSVKFLEMPTIHYEEEYETEPYRTPAVSVSAEKGGFLEWLLRPVRKQAVPDRPTISGPFPLWEAPRRARAAPAHMTSLRSKKSSSSLRSVQSCSSRMQTYWGRITGTDP